MGLLRMAARTAVVAGTATAVSGRVAHRQAERYAEKDQQGEEGDVPGFAVASAANRARDDQGRRVVEHQGGHNRRRLDRPGDRNVRRHRRHGGGERRRNDGRGRHRRG